MKRVFIIIGFWAMLAALNQVFALPRLYSDRVAFAYSRDMVALVVLMVVFAKTRWARFLLPFTSICWLIIVLFEWVRAVGLMAMKQSPLLYDAYFLAGHLYILLRDLMGFKATLLFAGIGVALFVVGAVSHLIFRWFYRTSQDLSWKFKLLFLRIADKYLFFISIINIFINNSEWC